jgi:hypothetical protein
MFIQQHLEVSPARRNLATPSINSVRTWHQRITVTVS